MGWLSKRRIEADNAHEGAKAAVRRGLAEVPHPAGAEVWERLSEMPSDNPDDRMLTSMAMIVDRNGLVHVDEDRMRALLIEAGFEYRGIADGTAPVFDRQQDQQAGPHGTLSRDTVDP